MSRGKKPASAGGIRVKRPVQDNDDIVRRAGRNFLSLFLSSMSSRVISFALNVAIARHSTTTSYAFANLNLEMLYTGTLVLVRDGVRTAVNSRGATKSATLVKLAWLVVVPLSIIVSMCVALYMLNNSTSGNSTLSDEPRAIWVVTCASALAALSEPMYVQSQAEMRQGTEAIIETVSMACRATSTYVAVVYFSSSLALSENTVSPFAFGILAHAISLLLCYGTIFGRASLKSLRSALDKSTVKTARGLWFLQSGKWILEEGENWALITVSTFNSDETGAYKLVANLGSLVARFLFQPAERMSQAVFANLVNDSEQLQQQLQSRIVGLTLVGSICAAFGPNYSHMLLFILYGERWSSTSAPRMLGVYCFYILTMSLNGISEAYVKGTSTRANLDKYSKWMVFLSVVFLAFLFGGVVQDPLSLIIANSVKMITRFVICYIFYFPSSSKISGTGIWPFLSISTWFAIFFGYAASSLSLLWLYDENSGVFAMGNILHVLVGVLCFVIVLKVSWTAEGAKLRILY